MEVPMNTPEYAGWIITYEYDEAGMGLDDTADRKASYRRFGELLKQALTHRFPGADVRVVFADSYNGARGSAVTAPTDEQQFGRAYQAVVCDIEELVAQVYEAGAWVEAK